MTPGDTLEREMERRLHDLSVRYELACTLAHPRPVAELLDDFLDRLARAVGAEVAVVFGNASDDAPWPVRASTGLGRVLVRRAVLTVEMRARFVAAGPAFTADPAFLAAALPGLACADGVFAGLHTGERLLGVLLVARTEPFAPPTVGLIHEMAGRLALRMDHARVYEELANAHLATAVTQAGDAIEVTDPDGRIRFVNPAWERLTGWSRAEAIGHPVEELLPAPRPDGLDAELLAGRPWTGRVTMRRRDGARLEIDATVTLVATANTAANTVVTVRRDRTEAVRAAAALRESEERYALATKGANDGLWDWKVQTDEVYYSERWKAILGCSDAEIPPTVQAWLDRVHPEDHAGVVRAFREHLSGERPHVEVEHRMRHREGHWVWVLARGLVFRDAEGRAVRMAGSQTDVTSRKGTESQLQYLANHDGLTGLPNRNVFTARLQATIDTGRLAPGAQWAALFIDLDRFKNVNDSLGHAVGDELLVEVGRRLCRCLRDGDVAARLGGDEFGVLLANVDRAAAIRIATRIHRALSLPIPAAGHEIFSGASIGIALGRDDYTEAGEALRDADTAMYTAKAEGRGRFHVFDAGLRARAVALHQLESDLHHAIGMNAFFLHYQPIVELSTSRIVGLEALLRWQHPVRGVVSPAEFVPLAEETGLIHTIWQQVMTHACTEARAWQSRAPGIYVSVNVSPVQFTEVDLVDVVERELGRSGLAPECLKIEITENALMRDAERTAAALARLRSLGVAISLDDFGTGYSSLSMLHRFPVQTLKIDRSFIAPLQTRPEEAAPIVRSIIALGRNLGIAEVVAEGVETALQAAALSRFGCSHAQGYFFVRPLPAEAVTRLLENGGVARRSA